MGYTITNNIMYVRDDTGNLVPVSMIASGADQTIKAIKDTASAAEAQINTKVSNANAAIEAKTDEQAARIPEVTTLAENVNELKGEIDNLPEIPIIKKLGRNIFDESTQIKAEKTWWYKVGSNVELVSDQYTNSYCAIEIPVTGIDTVTISTELTSNQSGSNVYNWFTVDKSYQYIGTVIHNAILDNLHPITIDVSGADMLLVNVTNFKLYLTGAMMVNAGADAIPYEPYKITNYIPDFGSDVTDMLKDRTEFLGDIRVKLNLPDKYELVVGDTFELFWKGVVEAADYTQYTILGICDKGNSYVRKYMWTPTAADVGTHKLTVYLYDNAFNLLNQGEVNLVVKQKASNPATEQVVICMGDSLMSNGTWVEELHRRLTATDGAPQGDGLTNIAFVGNNYSKVSNIPYCGYGGWTWNNYTTDGKSNAFMWITTNHDKNSADQHSEYKDSAGKTWKLETIEIGRIKIICSDITASLPATSGTLTWVNGGDNHAPIVYTSAEQAPGNPFWDESANALDISKFIAEQGKSTLDFVYVLLGWNMTQWAYELYISTAETFVKHVHAKYDNCRIVLLGIQYPSFDGIGKNYGATAALNLNYEQVWRVNMFNKILADKYAYVSCVNIAGQFDTEYNMQSYDIPVNNRSTKTISQQSNGVHPAPDGYYQIADAAYRDFVHKLQE